MSKTTNKYSPEFRERAVRLVLDNQSQHSSRWQAIMSISVKIGCSAHRLNELVKKAEVDSGKRAGVPTDVADKMKVLERENRELRQANEILRKASAYFARLSANVPFACRAMGRSSTAGRSDGVIYRHASRGAWGRADLHCPADCPFHVL